MTAICEALQAKLIWAVMNGESLWAKYAKAKYFRGGEISFRVQGSPLWRMLQ